MKNISVLCFVILLLYSLSLSAQESRIYRLLLKDKGNPAYSLDNPTEFLSQKSVSRRIRQGLVVDSTDLPIDTAYLAQIEATGASIKAQSKWLKTVAVQFSDSTVLEKFNQLAFVDTSYLVWTDLYAKPYSEINIKKKAEPITAFKSSLNNVNVYGWAYDQISMLNGHRLHESGYKGDGLSIAILDGGFSNCDVIDAFDFSKIAGVRNFTHLNIDPLRTEQEHGTTVLSCMLSNKSGVITGTAPGADYYLLLTEVLNEEFPVEEDYWMAGLEYADSIGVDLVNSSLGYTMFDAGEMNHVQSELDGYSVLMSRGAGMAAEKGMLIFNSAGNEGNKEWGKITFPADAKNIITVGAVNKEKIISPFSSFGPSADGRIKPDLLAMGSLVTIIDGNGNVVTSNGTSYACPILTGLAGCLWQALPELKSTQIMDLLKENADKYAHPDSVYGYGIPDVYQAYRSVATGIESLEQQHAAILYTDQNRLYLNLSPEETHHCSLSVYNSLGGKVMTYTQLSESVDISHLSSGVYIAYIHCGDMREVRKFIKF